MRKNAYSLFVPKTLSALVLFSAILGTFSSARAQPIYHPDPNVDRRIGEEGRRAEYERQQAASRKAAEQANAEHDAQIAAYFAAEKARKVAQEKAKAEAEAKAAEEYKAYAEAMKGPGGKIVLSALVCTANAAHNEIVASIREDNKYAGASGVVNLRQRETWKDQLQHWDMVASLAKRDGGGGSCKAKAVACLLNEDCESEYAPLFAKAWTEYTMQAYQQLP